MKTIHSLIPASRSAAVENALIQTFNTTALQEIILLTDGLSAAKVYKIVVKDQHYVLKLADLAEAIHDHSCMELAANAGVAPPVYYINKTTGITITGYIQHIPLHTAFKSPNILLMELTKTIRSIHELPLFSKESSLLDTVDGLVTEFKASQMLTGSTFDSCFAYYEVIKACYPWHDSDKVSSHNDLNPNNMIFDGEKIWIIDWEAAFKNDRYADLAITANFFTAADQEEHIMLETYFGDDLKEYNRARFFVMRQICRIVYAMLMFRLANASARNGAIHDPDMEGVTMTVIRKQLAHEQLNLAEYQGQLLFGKAMLNEAMNNMRSARFDTSIEELSRSKVS
ncbi:hypothetical protein AQ505_08735 [Pedobacter sp. PACM 27299]|uniref:phosphotransferase n=1 Tax=Pedobacter sp. PACM 27299 TaxID=1727164 RepID=UPI0007063F91|nr:phosphotransferase [Pedobacter sp. PACM 27299]ALL05568.1 hypothetical protein AQ505_08735 [Pedobacter sp. PACM 27299]